MAILAQLLRLLRLLEELQEALAHPVSGVAIATLLLYGFLIGFTDAPTAITLAGSVGLALACILTTPDF